MIPKSEASGQASSRIGKLFKFKGEIHSEQDLFVDGVVEGMISVPKNLLVIGASSQVNADVHAHSLILHGKLNGDVTVSERIEIKKTGSLQGNLVTQRIVVEDGGIFRGSCDTRSPEAIPAGEPAARKKRPAAIATPKTAEAARPGVAQKAPASRPAGRP